MLDFLSVEKEERKPTQRRHYAKNYIGNHHRYYIDDPNIGVGREHQVLSAVRTATPQIRTTCKTVQLYYVERITLQPQSSLTPKQKRVIRLRRSPSELNLAHRHIPNLQNQTQQNKTSPTQPTLQPQGSQIPIRQRWIRTLESNKRK